MRPGRRAVLPLLLAASVACGGGDAPSDAEPWRSTEPVWAAGAGWTVDPEPFLSIGRAAGEPAYLLSGVEDAARLPDGGIVVADGDSGTLRWFDAQGDFVRQAGGEGDGPGEFRSIPGVWLRGDVLLAFDRRLSRVSRFSLDGDFLGVEPVPMGDDYLTVADVFPSDAFLAEHRELSRVDLGVQVEDSVRWYRADPATDSLLPLASGLHMLTYAHRWETTVTPGRFPLSPRSYGALHGDSLLFGDGRDFVVHVVDGATGESLGRLGRRFERVSVTDEHVERYADWRIETAGPDAPAEQWREVFREAPRPEHLPATGRLLVDATGHLWVEHADRPWAEVRAWSVFDPDGRWLGEVEDVTGAEVFEIGPDWLLGRVEDELGVERVALFRLRR